MPLGEITMSKANNDILGELHGLVAKIMTKQLKQEALVEIDGEKVMMSMASPALIGQIVKFLKDNHTTADKELDDNLNNLEELLKHKKKRGKLQLISPQDAAGE